MKPHYVTFKVKYPIDLDELNNLSEEEVKAKILADFKYALDADITLFKEEVKLHPRTRQALKYENS